MYIMIGGSLESLLNQHIRFFFLNLNFHFRLKSPCMKLKLGNEMKRSNTLCRYTNLQNIDLHVGVLDAHHSDSEAL